MKKPTKAALYAKIKELESQLEESPRIYLKVGSFLYQGPSMELFQILETEFGRQLPNMELEECT